MVKEENEKLKIINDFEKSKQNTQILKVNLNIYSFRNNLKKKKLRRRS